jgi:hypothetical protein
MPEHGFNRTRNAERKTARTPFYVRARVAFVLTRYSRR